MESAYTFVVVDNMVLTLSGAPYRCLILTCALKYDLNLDGVVDSSDFSLMDTFNSSGGFIANRFWCSWTTDAAGYSEAVTMRTYSAMN